MNARKGFSLIEIAVVVLIISLIISGILVGKSMLRSAQIRGSLGEMQEYIQAVGSFRDKYQALPGDFAAATSIWGAAHATPATCITTVGTGSSTCNGDGNGRISSQTSGTYYEEFRAWQHLYSAGLTKQNVSGTAGSAGTHDRVAGVNIPSSQIEGAGWGLTSLTLADIGGGNTDIPYVSGDIPPNVVLWLGGRSSDSSNKMTPVLLAEDALVIDKRIDDGYSNLGKVVAQNNAAVPNCIINTSSYDTSQTTKVCALVFKTGF